MNIVNFSSTNSADFKLDTGVVNCSSKLQESSILDNNNNISVSSTTDFQKLIAKLKLDDEKTKHKQIVQGFQAVLTRLTRLTAQHSYISEVQAKALDEIKISTASLAAAKSDLNNANETLSSLNNQLLEQITELANLEEALDQQMSALAQFQAELNSSTTLLQTMTNNLAELVEAQHTTLEKRKKDIQRKEEKIQEEDEKQHKIDDLKKQIDDLRLKCANLQTKIEQKCGAVATTKSALESAQNAISKTKDNQITIQNLIVSVQQIISTENALLSSALKALDTIGMSVLADAIRITATQALAILSTIADDKQLNEQAISIKKLAEMIMYKLEEKRANELEKLIAKLPDALVWLTNMPIMVPANMISTNAYI